MGARGKGDPRPSCPRVSVRDGGGEGRGEGGLPRATADGRGRGKKRVSRVIVRAPRAGGASRRWRKKGSELGGGLARESGTAGAEDNNYMILAPSPSLPIGVPPLAGSGGPPTKQQVQAGWGRGRGRAGRGHLEGKKGGL